MTIKTPFSQQDFLPILSQYDLGTFIHADPVTQGSVQTNYFIRTTEGKYVLRYYENRARESVLFETHLLTYLKTHRYPCPTPVSNQQGAYVGMVHNKPLAVAGLQTVPLLLPVSDHFFIIP